MCVVCGGPVAPGLSFLLMASSRRCFLGRHPGRPPKAEETHLHSQVHTVLSLMEDKCMSLLPTSLSPLPFLLPLPLSIPSPFSLLFLPLLFSLRLQLLLGSLWLVSSLAISVFRVVARETSQKRVPPIWNSLSSLVAV